MQEEHSEQAEEKKPKRAEFIIEFWKSIKEKEKNGELPYLLMIMVTVYNLIIFEIDPSDLFYTVMPIVFLLISYYTQYWKQEVKWRQYLGIFSIIICILFDFVLSATYIPVYNDAGQISGYVFGSIPTLLMDTIASISLLLWIRRKWASLRLN
ncbi:MAG: hypothetical protein INQ03_10110 [Candidatus Heimdallarchaeota archaeon]|nr:hypothetical protein [Candidatus Heimdallarchaeota archaeon]